MTRFTLLRQLGRGAMGVVWQARDEESGSIVALKLLREVYADDPEYRGRFERELELARRVHSPHVVQVLGYGTREGTPYLALEYVDGPSLRERLAEHGPYPWPEARALLVQLAAGLADAHAAGILHRDVKPSNVLLASDGTAKLTDFGIARGLDLTRVTGTSTLLGTPAYLAPEGPLDARSDLYALGVIAYELLAGAPPFEGPTYQAVILAHIRTPPDLAKLPPEARSIVGWCLAKDPAERPQSAAELLAILQGQGRVPAIVPPRPAPAGTTPPSRPRHRRTLAGFGALALVVLLVGAALAMGGAPSHAGPLGSLAARRTGTSTPTPAAPASLLAVLPVASLAGTPALPSATPTPLVTPPPTPRVTPAPTPRATPTRRPSPGPTAMVVTYGVGASPQGVAFDGTSIWVANAGSNTVTKLAAASGAIVGTYGVGNDPVGLASDGTNIWVTNYYSNSVTKLVAATGEVVGTYHVGVEPQGVAFDGTDIWVANTISSTVTKLDAATGEVVGTYRVGDDPQWVLDDGTSIWVSNRHSDTVTKLDPATGAIEGTYPAHHYPAALASDGTNIWVVNDGVDSVTKLAAATGAVVGTYHLGEYPSAVTFDGTNIWVTEEVSNTVTELAAATGGVVGTYGVGASPQGVAFDGTSIWVANSGSNTVTKLTPSLP
jgi:glutamine cyclotransferase